MSNFLDQKNKGFVLLYALLVASIVLVIGLTMSNIIYKQLIISSVSREMNNAYYAANAGRECALMLHQAYGAVNKYKASVLDGNLFVRKTVKCLVDSQGYDLDNFTFNDKSEIRVSYAPEEANPLRKACAEVDVLAISTGLADNSAAVDNIGLVIARGYNADCDDDGNSRKVERILCRDFDSQPGPGCRATR